MSAIRIEQLLKDEDFQSVVEAYKARLTKKVMSAATSQEDREKALTKHHVVDDVLKGLISAAQQLEESSDNG
ncbi:MAG: hypothetical protein ACPG4X_15855 [Pikeienuella sp.]